MKHHCREFIRENYFFDGSIFLFNLNQKIIYSLLTVNETMLDDIPTIYKMRALFNNYELDSSINEYVSPIERQEENEFIDELLKTSVMKTAMKFLQDKGCANT